MQNDEQRKVVVIGLDCATPQLLFDRYRGQLPNLERLMARGTWGRLRSCDPPITVPAWSVMMSSKDPGTLGIYGFRNRCDYSYDKMAFATGTAVHALNRQELAAEFAPAEFVRRPPPSLAAVAAELNLGTVFWGGLCLAGICRSALEQDARGRKLRHRRWYSARRARREKYAAA